jgi:hypothetical protein
MSRKFVFSLVVFIATLCWSSSAFGQATGSFAGTVTDKSGSAVAGATVTVTSQGTGVARTATTDETGHYTINLLPVSVYTIHVEFKGFQATESKDVKLQVDEHRELDFSLSPATVSSTVEVTASEVAMETSNPSLGQVTLNAISAIITAGQQAGQFDGVDRRDGIHDRALHWRTPWAAGLAGGRRLPLLDQLAQGAADGVR